MNFEKVLNALLKEFEKNHISFALIGGLALNFAGVDRKTHDVDFIILLEDSDKIDEIMKSLGYKCLHRNENVANYHGLTGMGQVDFLFAHRKYSLKMLENARPHDFLGHKVKAVRPEDLIGLKIQSGSSDPKRASQDMLDIKGILQNNSGKLDLELVREYFKLFKREEEFNEILKEKT